MMTKDHYEEFSQIWLATASMFSAKQNDVAVAIAFRALQKYDIAEVKRAITAHVKNPDGGQFMPKPADLFRHLEGDSNSRALVAWTLINKSIGHYGRYETVVFDDPISMKVVEDMGGWIHICGIEESEIPFRREEFSKRYRGYLNTGLTEHPKKLIGVIEAQNLKDFPDAVPEPRLIGNPAKALEVYHSGGGQSGGSMLLSHAMKKLGGFIEVKKDSGETK